ncbi:hypothetical protein SUGI_0503120 [Cryptomeria japonica]|nr:hypothetical protein SUGI_0503120 [Cryptomeria japonica]
MSEFKDTIPISLQNIDESKKLQLPVYYTMLDNIVVADLRFGKFITEARNVIDNKYLQQSKALSVLSVYSNLWRGDGLARAKTVGDSDADNACGICCGGVRHSGSIPRKPKYMALGFRSPQNPSLKFQYAMGLVAKVGTSKISPVNKHHAVRLVVKFGTFKNSMQ